MSRKCDQCEFYWTEPFVHRDGCTHEVWKRHMCGIEPTPVCRMATPPQGDSPAACNRLVWRK